MPISSKPSSSRPAKPTPDSFRTSPHLTTSKLRGCSFCSVPARAVTTYCGCFRPLLPPNMLKTTTLQWHTASPLCLTPDRSLQRLLPLRTSHSAWGALASPQPSFKHKLPTGHPGQMQSPSSSNKRPSLQRPSSNNSRTQPYQPSRPPPHQHIHWQHMDGNHMNG